METYTYSPCLPFSFTKSYIQTTCTCTQSTCPTGIGDNDIIDNVDTKIATDSLPTGYCSDAIHWTGGRQLYSRLMANPSLINGNTDLQNFMNSASQNSIGAFYNIEQQIGALFTLDSTDQAQLDTNRTELATKTDQLLSVMEQLATDAENSQLLASRDQLSQDINALHQQNDGLLATFDGDKANAISAVRSANLAISVTSDYEQNQQRINDIFLQTIASDIYDFTAAQDSVILSIADQCVICGGDGVLLARSMYASVDPKKVFSDDVLCAGGQALKRPTSDPKYVFGIAPNPASNYVYLHFTEQIDLVGKITVLDTYGRLVQSIDIEMDAVDSYPLILDGIPSGIYTVSLVNDYKVLHTERLVLVK